MGRVTHQSELSDFIPLKRKGDVGNHWHLEIAMLLTTTQNVLCAAVSDRQEGLKSSLPSLSARAKDVLWFLQKGVLAGEILMPKLAVTAFVLQEKVQWYY